MYELMTKFNILTSLLAAKYTACVVCFVLNIALKGKGGEEIWSGKKIKIKNTSGIAFYRAKANTGNAQQNFAFSLTHAPTKDVPLILYT